MRGSGLDARLPQELRTNALELLEGFGRSVRALVRDVALALLDRDLAINLPHFLRERITEEIRLQIRERLDRLRALARAGASASGGTVVAVAVGHAIIIARV